GAALVDEPNAFIVSATRIQAHLLTLLLQLFAALREILELIADLARPEPKRLQLRVLPQLAHQIRSGRRSCRRCLLRGLGRTSGRWSLGRLLHTLRYGPQRDWVTHYG